MLKILTLNINFYGVRYGRWEDRKALIVDVIRDSGADIVALQAVRRDPKVERGRNQAEQLAAGLPEFRHLAFQPAMEYPDWSADGLAFLSRFPIADTTYLPLTLRPALEDTNQRIVFHAHFPFPDGPFHLFNAHLSWVLPQTRVNLVEALPYLNSFSGLCLLVGDFNLTPESELTELLEASGWVDLWKRIHPGEQGLTSFTFYEGNVLAKRIDYALTNGPLVDLVENIEVITGSQGPQGERLSDHAGLLVTLRM